MSFLHKIICKKGGVFFKTEFKEMNGIRNHRFFDAFFIFLTGGIYHAKHDM